MPGRKSIWSASIWRGLWSKREPTMTMPLYKRAESARVDGSYDALGDGLPRVRQRPRRGPISRGIIMAPQKHIFAFEDGDGKNKMLHGGKGAN